MMVAVMIGLITVTIVYWNMISQSLSVEIKYVQRLPEQAVCQFLWRLNELTATSVQIFSCSQFIITLSTAFPAFREVWTWY
jgi:hypothetical protein